MEAFRSTKGISLLAHRIPFSWGLFHFAGQFFTRDAQESKRVVSYYTAYATIA